MAGPAVIPILEALGEILISREAQSIATDAVLTGVRAEFQAAATELVLGRSQLLTELVERSVVVEQDLGRVTAATEAQHRTLIGDIMKDPSKVAAAISDDSAALGGSSGGTTALQDLQSFVKWSAGQVWEQLLFQVAMDATERILHGGGGASMPPDDLLRATHMMGALADAFKALNATSNDWYQWLVDHLRKKKTYGMVDQGGIQSFRFDLFRTQLTGLGNFVSDRLVPALATAKRTGSLAAYRLFRTLLVEYAAEVRKVGEGIKAFEPLMVAAGLKDHLAEIGQAVELASEASV
jgi:hypothetical protein